MELTLQLGLIAANMLHDCPVLCEQLGLDGLARLATCSKAMSKTVETVLIRDSLGLLDSALNIARQNEQKQQHKQAAAWLAAVLLRKTPSLAVDVSERLLHLPSVPLATAKQLVAAGVRVTYAQLLAAAHGMVAGVEVWVQAQQRLNVLNDIPAVAVSICCGEDWVSYACTRILGLQLAVHLQGCWCAILSKWSVHIHKHKSSIKLCLNVGCFCAMDNQHLQPPAMPKQAGTDKHVDNCEQP
jgi:hypothetical protein